MPVISYRELSNWISALALLVAGGIYFHRVFEQVLAGVPLSHGAILGFGIVMIALLVAIEVVFHILVAGIQVIILLRNPDQRGDQSVEAVMDEPMDERDRLIDAKASRNGYYVLDIGGLMAAALLFTTDETLLGMQYLLLALTLGQLTRYVTRIVFYRMES